MSLRTWHRRPAGSAALLLAALALAGCGGGDGDGGNGEAGGNGNGAATGDTGAAGGTTLSGEAVFAEYGCGGCHALEEAGSSGQTGPELDGANLSVDRVAEQVRNGGGGMPAFGDRMSEEEIQAVSEFVASASEG